MEISKNNRNYSTSPNRRLFIRLQFYKNERLIQRISDPVSLLGQPHPHPHPLLSLLVPVVSQVKLVTPVQGNYSYSLWQLGTLQLLVRSSFHGFTRSNTSEEELLTCYAKLEYQPQFGFEQITDAEYRRLWLHSYLRQGTSLLLGKSDLRVSLHRRSSSGRINAFTQQVMKVEKITFENINQNLKECQIE